MTRQNWDSLPYLDAIRPDPGWRVEYAVVATYSADLVAVVAALLAFAGLDDDRGSGTKMDLADACEMLRRRVRFVVQRGRVSLPRKTSRIIGICDQFIREVPADERKRSWHPKTTVVSYRNDADGRLVWRLWLGSRNLTQDISWDTGILLTGTPGQRGTIVPGIPPLVKKLAEFAELPEIIRLKVAGVQWDAPAGTSVKDVKLFCPGELRDIPSEPKGVSELLLVSPFLDANTVRKFGSWGADEKTHRTILSTGTALAKLLAQAKKPLSSYAEMLYLDEALTDEPHPEFDEAMESDEDVSRGLHAKILSVKHSLGRTLWVGSANATTRGWSENYEVLAELTVDETVYKGLRTFADSSQEFDSSMPPVIDPDDPTEKDLADARNEVAAIWDVQRQIHADRNELVAKVPPHPHKPAIELEVGILGEALHTWPRGASSLILPLVPRPRDSEFIHIRLSLNEKSQEWCQRVPVNPPLGEERDRLAFASYLGPRMFLQWLRSLLLDNAGSDGGGDWTSDKTGSTDSGVSFQMELIAPSLEDILRAWTRNRKTLADINLRVTSFLKAFEQHETDATPEELAEIEKFQELWKMITQGLV
ncbi:hypothetical protein GeomeDRAFT_2239 [Geobacter metallireducens RCH3]|uniref:Uncharacterized protein n=1 Tax=Geobacter metallireducens (strain ATCC 53774 / DSM 7210 / GS-15) TaxID=269799 RepID=Q39R50_GEOMG|nr:phospholipase D family protein [Geobacter metallireducens]ABB33274.1 hypothetical protein Gmet_3059 [Geobacter metallireducens GS-15]EHP85852.1 hypothetical protein GeomeDRAFT_2239 [Geobacter metallireducens RCH3]